MAAGLEDMKGNTLHQGQFVGRAVEATRVVLPYVLHPLDDTKLVWLNRDYKPLGVLPYGTWVNYADFPTLHVERSNPAVQAIWDRPRPLPTDELVYLFHDTDAPWIERGYSLRLLARIDKALATVSTAGSP
jgi:hypothetical protein